MIIHNGDHAEYEIENANTPPKDRPDWPLPSFDARDWAEHYVKLHDGDFELMTTWFANALMRGFDEHASRGNDALTAARERIGVLEGALKPFADWREDDETTHGVLSDPEAWTRARTALSHTPQEK